MRVGIFDHSASGEWDFWNAIFSVHILIIEYKYLMDGKLI